jgi:hypothetical protein
VAQGYEVVTQALVGHATALGRVADQLSTALDAANTVRLPRDAYGVICQFFPPMVDPIEQAGVDAIATGVRAMQDTATEISNTARDYDSVEVANASAFRGGA